MTIEIQYDVSGATRIFKLEVLIAGIRRGAEKSGEAILDLAREIVPVRTGQLKRSLAFKLQDPFTIEFYGVYYGVYVEARVHFLETSVERYLQNMVETYRESILSEIERVK